MASLIDRLYPLPDYRRSTLSLLRWWESRRLFYNRVVGMTGLVTLSGLFVLVPDRPAFFAPGLVFAVLAYGVMANVCYTFGWLAELVARAVWGSKAPDLGPFLFREGLIFSVGVTALPLLVGLMVWVARLLVGLVT